jgi:nucleotide-binding universal stress UspA family protein
MARKILLAVDESNHSVRAVRYVAETMPCNASVTMLSVVPDMAAACRLEGPSLVPIFKENREAFCSMEDTKRERIKEFMEKAKNGLVKAGFPAKNIRVKVRKKKKGVARDILAEAKEGGYDTIVVGRRGLSGVKEFFLGSVSQKVLQNAANITVVVVD